MKKLDKFSCVVMMNGDKLQKCDIKADGGPDMWAGSLNWQEVKGPVTQDFIDAVNKALDVNLTITNFSKKLAEKGT